MNKEELTVVITKAITARNAVRDYIKKNKSAPKIKLPAVLEFQKVEPSLEDDGFYGPNSEMALKYYLATLADNEVPKSHTAFSKSTPTWQKPVIDVPKVAASPSPVVTEKPKEKPKEKAKAKPQATKKEKETKVAKTASGGIFGNIAKDVAKSVKKAKEVTKKVSEVIKDIPKHGQTKLNNDFDAEEALADSISAPIDRIKQLLEEQENQDIATNEHNNIVKEDKFKEDVLSSLTDIQKRVKLIQQDPIIKSKDYRILGLFI